MEDLNSLLQTALGYHLAGDFRRAQPLYVRAMHDYPESGDAPHLLGMIADAVGEHETALKLVSEAIQRNPQIALFHNNLGEIWRNLGNLPLADACYRKALEIEPNYALANCNLATVLMGQGILDEAADCLSKSLAANPDLPQAHWNAALLLLLAGDYAAGWPEYEWRFRLGKSSQPYPHHYDKPRWSGEPLPGKRLLVHDEQGLGDSIQFARYLLLAKRLVGTLIFECNPALVNIFKNLDGVDEVVARSDLAFSHERFDYHIPLLSLPMLFGTTPENIPPPVELICDSERDRYWARSLMDLPGKKSAWCGQVVRISGMIGIDPAPWRIFPGWQMCRMYPLSGCKKEWPRSRRIIRRVAWFCFPWKRIFTTWRIPPLLFVSWIW